MTTHQLTQPRPHQTTNLEVKSKDLKMTLEDSQVIEFFNKSQTMSNQVRSLPLTIDDSHKYIHIENNLPFEGKVHLSKIEYT